MMSPAPSPRWRLTTEEDSWVGLITSSCDCSTKDSSKAPSEASCVGKTGTGVTVRILRVMTRLERAARRSRAPGARLTMWLLLLAGTLTVVLPYATDESTNSRTPLHVRSQPSSLSSLQAAPSAWTRASSPAGSAQSCAYDHEWKDARGRDCSTYADTPEDCMSAAHYAVDGKDAVAACCDICSWLRIAVMPATKIVHFRGNELLQAGGVAGVEFDLQPALNVSGRYSFVEATLGNNPGCSRLNGNTIAAVVDGLAAFTDLWVDKASRGYTLTFCAGQCSKLQPWVEASDVSYTESETFDIQPGRLHIVQEPGRPEAGVPIEAEIEVQHVTSYGSVRHWEAFTTYNFSVTVSLDGVQMSGRRTLWPIEGRVRFTDLIINAATKPAESGFRLVYRSCYGASEGSCAPSYTQLAMPGQAMLQVSQSFRVTHTAPSEVVVATQPNLTLAGYPLGSICENQVGIECKKFRATKPPAFKFVDRFGNNVDTGSWFACITLLHNSSTTYQLQPLLGITRIPLDLGVAVFDSLFINEVKMDYILNVTIYNQDLHTSCESAGFGWVVSEPFHVTPSSASQIVVIRSLNTSAGAGLAFTQQPLVALQDDSGNAVLQADDIDVFAQIHRYRPDPGDRREPSGLSLFASCVLNPFTGNNENCVQVCFSVACC